MTFKYRYRKQIILGIIIFVVLGSLIGLGIYKFKSIPKKKEIVVEKKLEKKIKVVEDNKIQVDIKGEINNPGIYKVDGNSRIIDVIHLAGELTENADTSVINLSKKVSDEMVIIIYSKEEVSEFKKTKEIEKQVEERCIQKDDESIINNACISNSSTISNNSKVSINTGTLEELQNLTGIGEKKAKDIISYREKNGPFKTIEEIKNVSGIGENSFAQIKENITI